MPGRRIGPVGPAADPCDRSRGHRPLARVDAADLSGDGHRAAARDDPVDGFLLPEGVAGLELPGYVGPAAGEADRRAERLTGLARVEPVGRGEQILDRLRGPLGHVVRGVGGRRLGLGGGRGRSASAVPRDRDAAGPGGPLCGGCGRADGGRRGQCGAGAAGPGGQAGRDVLGRRRAGGAPPWRGQVRPGGTGPGPGRGQRSVTGRGGAGRPGPRLSRPGRGVSASAALLVLLRRRHRVPSPADITSSPPRPADCWTGRGARVMSR